MYIHILGIGGTFMGGIATLAKALGHTVTGSDQKIYPPMSNQLKALEIPVYEEYKPVLSALKPDCVIVGNVVSRGNLCVEEMLNQGFYYTSGPAWLYENILRNRCVIAVSGTHGKTTTTGLLAWIFECSDLTPGFLIGGVPKNFGISARLGTGPFFIIEADEYDTAFFDKRSKFIHYRPHTLVINNLEFDHADIFENLAAIQKQFHHLIRTVPEKGKIIYASDETSITDTLKQGCWTSCETFGSKPADWICNEINQEGCFRVSYQNKLERSVKTTLQGTHNQKNILAAMAAAFHAGISLEQSAKAMSTFTGIARRMELKGIVNEIRVYDDFAHHPTAIKTTLGGLRHQVGKERIIAVLEPRSNTMRLGVHQEALRVALKTADQVLIYQPPSLSWDLHSLLSQVNHGAIYQNTQSLITALGKQAKPHDYIVIMSNGHFENIHERLLDALRKKQVSRNEAALKLNNVEQVQDQ